MLRTHRFSLVATVVALVVIGCGDPVSDASITGPKPPPTVAPTLTRVVWMGDSFVNHLGDLTAWFGPSASAWLNDGVGGLASFQLLPQFSNVPANTQVVVVLIGINDIVGGAGTGGDYEDVSPNGPSARNGSIGQNVAIVADSLRALHMLPVLVTLPPVLPDYPQAASINARILTLNAWTTAFAQVRGYAIIDAAAAFTVTGAAIPELYASDGLHPNSVGNAALVRASVPVLQTLGVALTR